MQASSIHYHGTLRHRQDHTSAAAAGATSVQRRNCLSSWQRQAQSSTRGMKLCQSVATGINLFSNGSNDPPFVSGVRYPRPGPQNTALTLFLLC